METEYQRKSTIWNGEIEITYHQAAERLGCSYDTLRERLRILRRKGTYEVGLHELRPGSQTARERWAASRKKELAPPKVTKYRAAMETNQTEPKKEGAAAAKYRRDELRPLPMRISQGQYERLLLQRDFDNINIQEHVRRALDFYLNAQDQVILRAQQRKGLVPLTPEHPPVQGLQPPPSSVNVPANSQTLLPKVRSR